MSRHNQAVFQKSPVTHTQTARTPRSVAPTTRPESTRCRRPHCGGLLLARDVVTVEGVVREVVCSACGRSILLAIRDPYGLYRVRFSPQVERSLQSPAWARDRAISAALDSDDSMDIAWDRSRLDDAAPLEGSPSQCPRGVPRD